MVRAQGLEDRQQCVRRCDGKAVGSARQVAHGVQQDAAAAIFVALAVIGDQAEFQRLARFEQQLPARQPAVAVVDVGFARRRIVDETVALLPDTVEPRRDLVADRRVEHAVDAPVIIIAIADRTLGAEAAELGAFGDDVDQPRGRVAPEQGALRPAQHFDALDVAEFGQADPGAAAIDAVDEQADRRFEPGIFTDRADAADTRREIDFARRARHEQRRRDLSQRTHVGRAGLFQRLACDRRDRDRHVGQRLAAPRRGDDDRFVVRRGAGFLRRGRRGPQGEDKRQARGIATQQAGTAGTVFHGFGPPPQVFFRGRASRYSICAAAYHDRAAPSQCNPVR